MEKEKGSGSILERIKYDDTCEKCKGRGIIKKENFKPITLITCPKCLGDGTLDWIEKATGKKPKHPEPPLSKIINEGGSSKICFVCGSSLKRNWKLKLVGCFQPKCTNYYRNERN